jgi:PKD repeat protein
VTPQVLSGENPTYTFATPGNYTIILKVFDVARNSEITTVTITVLDVTKPVANAGQDRTVKPNEIVTFDASASTDNVGIVSYEWNFGDGTTGIGRTTTHTYTNETTYTVTLTVKDSAGNTATQSVKVTVRSPGPLELLYPWIIGGVAVVIVALAVALLLRKRNSTARS